MFMNKYRFNQIGGWDKKIFLYFEETDFCYRAKKLNLFCYQINKIKTQTVDTTVKIEDKKVRENWLNLLIWHFIWSKFYFTKKIRSSIFNFYFYTNLYKNIISHNFI